MQNRSWFPWFLLSAGRRRCEARPSKNWRQCVRTVATEDCSNWEKMLSAPREQTLTFGSHTPAVSNPRHSGRGTPDLVAGVKVTTRSWLCPLEAKKLLCHGPEGQAASRWCYCAIGLGAGCARSGVSRAKRWESGSAWWEARAGE